MQTIVVDFDGTIVEHDFPGIGKIKPYAVIALKAFHDAGYRIIVHSCRNNLDIDPKRKTLKAMSKFLGENGLDFCIIDVGTRGKPVGDFYIDDRAIEYKNNWQEIAERILWP